MTRRRKRTSGGLGVSLDSLMDILTCSVGVMFIVVILAVTEARGTSVRVRLPLAQEPPAEVARVLLLCTDGEIRPFRFDLWVDQALETAEETGVTFNSLPRVVEAMNGSILDDAFFTYQFEMRESERNFNERQRRALIVVNERTQSEAGVTIDRLRTDPTAITELLDGLDPETHWISFQVDETSIGVFREARALIAERGFATGWDPASWDFPLRETVLGGGPGSGGPGVGREVQ